MTRNPITERFGRYNRLGGLSELARQYEQGQISLTQIADRIGCSRGTVHNDFVRGLGKARYAETLRIRKNNDATAKRLKSFELRKILVRRFNVAKDDAPAIRLLVATLTRAEQFDSSFLTSMRAGGAMRFFLSDERPVRIRTALPDGNQPEHRFGLHRFRVSPGISRYDFAVFAIGDRSSVTTYIFRTSEIASVQSLALRYKWFERKSRYDFARDRWAILKACQKP
jgi:hypothetical protein